MNTVTVAELSELLRKLNTAIKNTVQISGFDKYGDWSCIEGYETITDSDQLQLLDVFQPVMQNLCRMHNQLSYYERPVLGEGTLTRNERDYFEDAYREYHCGDTIEFCFCDPYSGKCKWRTSILEHNGKRYYIAGNPDTELEGLRVRHR